MPALLSVPVPGVACTSVSLRAGLRSGTRLHAIDTRFRLHADGMPVQSMRVQLDPDRRLGDRLGRTRDGGVHAADLSTLENRVGALPPDRDDCVEGQGGV